MRKNLFRNTVIVFLVGIGIFFYKLVLILLGLYILYKVSKILLSANNNMNGWKQWK